MAIAPKKDPAIVHLLPEARVLWHALFERDAYKKDEKSAPGNPLYKILLGLEPGDVKGEGTIEDKMADAVEKEFGADAAQAWLDNERGYVTNFKDGTKMANEREVKAKLEGKERDYTPYRGKIIVSADTAFNSKGDKDAGGCSVYGPWVETIGIVEGNTGLVYPGCYGVAAVTISVYKDNRNDIGVKFYLSAFQKTRDGERLKSGDGDSNRAGLFKPVTAPTGVASEGRRRRAG